MLGKYFLGCYAARKEFMLVTERVIYTTTFAYAHCRFFYTAQLFIVQK